MFASNDKWSEFYKNTLYEKEEKWTKKLEDYGKDDS